MSRFLKNYFKVLILKLDQESRHSTAIYKRWFVMIPAVKMGRNHAKPQVRLRHPWLRRTLFGVMEERWGKIT
jgi:hypothetical protein